MEQQHIDELLERYLGLLDEYSTLRKNLSQLQTGVYQDIARANFSGERGMRYGKDHYDERMQAVRRLNIEMGDKQYPTFDVINGPEEEPEVETKSSKESNEDKKEDEKEEGNEGNDRDSEEVNSKDAKDGSQEKTPKKKQNPLHWFGLFAPMPLRTAQEQSIKAVEQIIPRLVSVNVEMLGLEIEVRRARKRRAKAEAAAEKAGEAASKTTEAETQTQTQATSVETS
ncbi:hypothetical protein BGZ63DRAFT_405930 [Mariannaea sp. PMI_226]|nr:hypothetical protein BGZ63DRAFT_405930 [Mariannaea sp. PMI_226]